MFQVKYKTEKINCKDINIKVQKVYKLGRKSGLGSTKEHVLYNFVT